MKNGHSSRKEGEKYAKQGHFLESGRVKKEHRSFQGKLKVFRNGITHNGENERESERWGRFFMSRQLGNRGEKNV
jgi:hypothetical protein